MKVKSGKRKGEECAFFECNYCPKSFQGPSSSAILDHLRGVHRDKCPELLLTKQISKPPRDLFDKSKMKKPFDADIFMGKLLKWMV